nr:hypothetical protein [Tanacetum cinerariifolium]
MEAIEKRFGGNTETKKVQKTLLKQQYENFLGSSTESLDQIHDRLHKLISQLEILRVSLSQEDINLKFLRSLPSKWRTHTLIWRNKTNLEEQMICSISLRFMRLKLRVLPLQALVHKTLLLCLLLTLTTLMSHQYSSPQLDNDDLKQIDDDDLEEMDLKWQMATVLQLPHGHFVRECRSPKDSRRNGATEPQRRNVPVETTTSNALVSQCDGVGSYDWSFQAKEEPTNYALMAFASSSLGYNSQVFTRAMFDCDDYLSSLSDESLPPSFIYDRYQSGIGYHVVPPPYTGTFMPPKPNLVFNNAPNVVETDHPAFNVKLSPTEPDQDLPSVQHVETSILAATPKSASPKPTSNGKCMNRKACFVCKILTHFKIVPINSILINVVRPVSIDIPKTSVTRPKQVKPIVTKCNSPNRRHINRSPSPKVSNSSPRVTTVKAPVVNATQGLQGKWEWKPKCPILDHVSKHKCINDPKKGNPQHALKDKGVIDSGCSMVDMLPLDVTQRVGRSALADINDQKSQNPKIDILDILEAF